MDRGRRNCAAELAWHCEQGRDHARAIPYLQQAAATAVRRHAHQEAIDYLQRALALLQTLPDTPERRQQELHVHVALGGPLMATKGQAAPEVEQTYSQAYALCQQVEDTAQLLPVLAGLRLFYVMQAAHQTAQELSQRLLTLAERHHDRAFLLEAQVALGGGRFFLGQFDAALVHLQQGHGRRGCASPPTARVCPSPQDQRHVFASWVLWCLGYPDQALVHSQEALTRAQRLSNPYILMWCQSLVANLHVLRGEAAAARQLAEASLALATTLEVPFWGARSTFMRGIALTRQGCTAEGLEQMQEGWAAIQTTGVQLNRGLFPRAPCRSPAACRTTGHRAYRASRGAGVHTHLWGALVGSGMPSSLGGVLTRPARAQTRGWRGGGTFSARARYRPTPTRQVPGTVRCHELESPVAAAGKAQEARALLAEVYGWFTEGFDTADLQEAKALLEELGC